MLHFVWRAWRWCFNRDGLSLYPHLEQNPVLKVSVCGGKCSFMNASFEIGLLANLRCIPMIWERRSLSTTAATGIVLPVKHWFFFQWPFKVRLETSNSLIATLASLQCECEQMGPKMVCLMKWLLLLTDGSVGTGMLALFGSDTQSFVSSTLDISSEFLLLILSTWAKLAKYKLVYKQGFGWNKYENTHSIKLQNGQNKILREFVYFAAKLFQKWTFVLYH